MKKLFPFAFLFLGIASTGMGAPALALGSGAEVFLTATVGMHTDDNILLASQGENDLIFDVSPGAELVFGRDSQLKGSLSLLDAFATYADHSELNTNLFSGDLVSNFDDGKFKLGVYARYHELNQNTFQTRGLVRRDVFLAGGDGEIEVSPITSISAGLSFFHENYKRKAYLDSDSLTVPLYFFYKSTPKLDLGLGYRYRDYEIEAPGQDSTDQFFSVAARGEFSPKLAGRLALGLNNRKLTRGGNESQLGVDGNLTYEVSPKTSIQLGVSNDFGTSPQGQQQKNLAFNGLVITKLTTEWNVNGALTYRKVDYGSRKDDYYEGQIGVGYQLNENVQIVGAYVYRKYNTDLKGSEFSNNVFYFAANLRY